jgi:colicin import membrane protein
MQANSPGAFFLSATMHGAVVAAILIFSYLTHEETKEPPKVFELVAGEGDNYAATEAPALGTPDGIKVPIAAVPAPKIEPVAQPEPSPVQPTAPEPVIERAPPTPAPKPKAPAAKPTDDSIRDFTKDVNRIAKKREAKLTAKFRKEREAEERKAKEAELKAKRMTKEEFDRMNRGAASPKGGSSTKISRIDAEGIAKGVVGGSTANKTGGANGKALTREEGSALDAYFAYLKQRLLQALDKPPGLADSLVVTIEVRIAADGTLSGAHIASSSGNAEFDHAALEAIARVRSIGPKPDGKSELITVPFRMKEIDED